MDGSHAADWCGRSGRHNRNDDRSHANEVSQRNHPDAVLLNLFRDIFPAARCVLLICFLSTTNTPQLAAGIFYWWFGSEIVNIAGD